MLLHFRCSLVGAFSREVLFRGWALFKSLVFHSVCLPLQGHLNKLHSQNLTKGVIKCRAKLYELGKYVISSRNINANLHFFIIVISIPGICIIIAGKNWIGIFFYQRDFLLWLHFIGCIFTSLPGFETCFNLFFLFFSM